MFKIFNVEDFDLLKRELTSRLVLVLLVCDFVLDDEVDFVSLIVGKVFEERVDKVLKELNVNFERCDV